MWKSACGLGKGKVSWERRGVVGGGKCTKKFCSESQACLYRSFCEFARLDYWWKRVLRIHRRVSRLRRKAVGEMVGQ